MHVSRGACHDGGGLWDERIGLPGGHGELNDGGAFDARVHARTHGSEGSRADGGPLPVVGWVAQPVVAERALVSCSGTEAHVWRLTACSWLDVRRLDPDNRRRTSLCKQSGACMNTYDDLCCLKDA